MGERRVTTRELAPLLEKLREEGAVNVRRKPPRFDGTVDVTWDEPGTHVAGERDFAAEMDAWKPVYLVSIAVVLVAMSIAALLLFLRAG